MTEDGGVVRCRKNTDEGIEGWILNPKQRADDPAGKTYFREGGVRLKAGELVKLQAERAADEKPLNIRFYEAALQRTLESKHQTALKKWAKRLGSGVTASVLREYGCVVIGDKLYSPERRLDGTITSLVWRRSSKVGFQERFPQHDKQAVSGSKRTGTLLLPEKLKPEYQRLIVCEGASDTLAVAALFNEPSTLVVGRPNKNAESKLIIDLANRHKVRECVVFLDNDKDAGGEKQGHELATRLAEGVPGSTAKAVKIPSDYKDVRAYLQKTGYQHEDTDRLILMTPCAEPEFKYKMLHSSRARWNCARPELLVRDMFLRVGTHIVFGEAQAGKSSMVYAMIASMLAGRSWGKNRTEVRPHRALLFSLENGMFAQIQGCLRDLKLSEEEIDRVIEGTLVDACDRPPPLNNLKEMQEVFLPEVRKSLRWIPEIIVIDTLSKALAGLDENSSQDMAIMESCCRAMSKELRCCVIVVHHSGKTNKATARGSSVITGDFDGVTCITKGKSHKGTSAYEVELSVEVQKLRSYASNKKYTFSLKDNPGPEGHASILELDEGAHASKVKNVKHAIGAAEQKIRNVLERMEGAWTLRKQLRKQLKNIPERTFERTLENLYKTKVIEKQQVSKEAEYRIKPERTSEP
jgi:RecA-family ATPase/5S rRNA maturation endonuclease (ribonuclease M5)